MEDWLKIDEQFTDEERGMHDAVTRFVQENILKDIATAYEEATFPVAWQQGLAKLGLFGLTLPEKYGGSGAGAVAYGLVCQALEKGDSGLRSFVSVQNSLCMYPIYAFGTEAQKLNFLPKMAEGRCIGCFGLTEPDAGSDPIHMKTTAKKVAGGWRLNGSKLWITNATIADIAIVWANTDQGIRGFLVEKGTPGFEQQLIKHKLSLRASVTGGLFFDDCFIPDSHFLPGSEQGLKAPLSCLTKARYGIAWGAIGAAMDCYETALSYSKGRIQFKKPIASFQLVQKDLVEMATEILKARTLNLHVGRLLEKDQGTPAMVSLIKMNSAKQALHIARQARNLLGANGISAEYPVMRHMNNLESVFTYEGTDNMHHLIVGKHLTGISAFE